MRTIEERFWAKVRKGASCWEWTAAKRTQPDGHGVMIVRGRLDGAHRISWQLHRGPIPAGLDVCHHCDNPPCVNPDHLFIGTHGDNMADRDAKGRLITPMGRHERAKTHCRQGHPYNAANTKVRRGKRECRRCHREAEAARRLAAGKVPGAHLGRYSGMTACTRGHRYTDANTRITGSGSRVCRTCSREYMRDRRKQGKA